MPKFADPEAEERTPDARYSNDPVVLADRYRRFARARKLRRFIYPAIALIVLCAAVIAGLLLANHKTTVIPARIKSQLNFGVFWPEASKTTAIAAQNKTIKYDADKKVFSYIATVDSNSITVTEQSTPDAFNDIPDYLSAITNQLNNYTTFDSLSGKVYITAPPNTTGEVAVMNEKGTLLFAHAEKQLSTDRWKAFVNSFTLIK